MNGWSKEVFSFQFSVFCHGFSPIRLILLILGSRSLPVFHEGVLNESTAVFHGFACFLLFLTQILTQKIFSVFLCVSVPQW